jgi:pimeloyl-ACP methyl ester carboxylesterase
VLETVSGLGVERAAWVGHSFGARVAVEAAETAPTLVERLVLLDPALSVPGPVALDLAEEERADRSFSSRAEARDRRAAEEPRAPAGAIDEELDEHLVLCSNGRLRYRYCQSAVVAMYGEVAGAPSTVPPAAPTLLVRGAESEFVADADVAALRDALGAALEVVTVPGGHIVLWDAFAETADAVERFLGEAR